MADQHTYSFIAYKKHFAWASLAVHSLDLYGGSGPNWEHDIGTVKQHFAALFRRTTADVHLFHNTTAAAHRALTTMAAHYGQGASILTTDLEYPGIVSMIDETWNGPVYVAKLDKFVWDRRCSAIPDVLLRSIFLVRPDVIYLSHVARSHGYVIPADVIARIRASLPFTSIIIDGAQAIGNIYVNDQILPLVDVYLTSGHKWLGGKPTLGIAIADSRWPMSDPSQSYTRTDGSGGTGDAWSLRCLANALDAFLNGDKDVNKRVKSVAAETAKLSRHFCNMLTEIDCPLRSVSLQPHWIHNGIVTLYGKDAIVRRIASASGLIQVVLNQEQIPAIPCISTIEQEAWLPRTTNTNRPYRHFIDSGIGRRTEPTLRDIMDLGNESTGGPNGQYLRISIHSLAHNDEDCKNLINVLHSTVQRPIVVSVRKSRRGVNRTASRKSIRRGRQKLGN